MAENCPKCSGIGVITHAFATGTHSSVCDLSARRLRVDAGISIRTTAADAGVSPVAICNIENGVIDLSSHGHRKFLHWLLCNEFPATTFSGSDATKTNEHIKKAKRCESTRKTI